MERFEIRRTLGEGGMGVVYEARDTARDMIVALKSLRTQDANLLYHFKNEFRSIAGLHHENLVTLYELFESAGQWFFTMELVEGCDFTAWVRPQAKPASRGESGTMLEYVTPSQTPAARSWGMVAETPSPATAGFDEARLRDALAQLASGLTALHDAGKVHRDIKPNNILVTPEGRVVIMDFGLVADDALLAELATVRAIAGTPAFMAPEQGVPGAAVGTPADWYAVGVMLYLVLAGRLPFAGDSIHALIAAKHLPPPPLDRIGIPSDLAELCERLLAPDPGERPTGVDVLRLLGSGPAAISSRTASGDVFVGRRAELGVLHAAVADSRERAVAVFVEGTSGLGKTALVRRFLDELAGTGTLILKGRCYAEETVPYKAFDGIVDALTRYLVTLPANDSRDLLPASAHLAARLFPVIGRVPWMRIRVQADMETSGLELRSRAFAAIVELIARVAARQPLVLFVDDLQWADADSLLLLRELLHPSSAPPFAFVASIRTVEGEDPNADLAGKVCADPRRVQLRPLAQSDAALLVDRLLPRDVSPDRRSAIAREAGGHPLFLAELAHHLASHAGLPALAPRLDDALWERALALDDDARTLLQVIAVAGTPIDQRTAAEAAEQSPTHGAPLISALRAQRFVKTSATAGGDNLVEPYHDRVRESVVARLSRDTFAAVSRRLANAMLRAGLGDTSPELVVRHLFAGGDAARGGALAEVAASRALGALAFDRAAEFLRASLSAGPRDAAHAHALHLALADALANAGRGAEAADAFLAAGAQAAGEETRLDCRRRAADQLLASGHVARGLTELGGVLAQLGEQVPDSPQASLASLESERAALDTTPIVAPRAPARAHNMSVASIVIAELDELVPAARANAPVERSSLPAIGGDLVRRLDVYQSTSVGLLLVDNVRGADFQARALRLAIAAGEPRRLVRALVFEAIYRSQESDTGRYRALELLDVAADIARGRNDAWMDAYLVFAAAFQAYYVGRFRRAVELFKDADARFRTLPGVAWEQNTIRLHRLRATDYQGAWGELRPLYDEYLRDAQRRDDRYAAASITRWFNVLWLAHDRPDLAGADLDRSEWSPPDEGRYHLQHFLELRARVELALYRGDGASQGSWARPGLAAAERSLLFRIQIARAIGDWLLGRIAACEGDVDETLLRARRLADQRINYATIWGGLLAAAAIARRGDRAGAIARLDATANLCDANDFPLCATIARLRSAELASDSTRVDAALAWMRGQDIVNPLRMCEVFAPGFR